MDIRYLSMHIHRDLNYTLLIFLMFFMLKIYIASTNMKPYHCGWVEMLKPSIFLRSSPLHLFNFRFAISVTAVMKCLWVAVLWRLKLYINRIHINSSVIAELLIKICFLRSKYWTHGPAVIPLNGPILLHTVVVDWEAVCIRSSSFTFPSFVFYLSGYAGMRVLKCVADLVQAAHSCVTLQDIVLAEGQITAFTTLILLSIVWYRLYLVTQQK